MFALGLVLAALPFFNDVADKKINIPWASPIFWLLGIGFSMVTGLVAGSYPALYLSSFNPVKVLKGTFKAGRFAAVPRKILVVLQFTVSVILVIATIVVFKQIQYAKNRPIGYDRTGLVSIRLLSKGIHEHFEAVKNELKSEGAITEMAESFGSLTENWQTNGGFYWQGKDPGLAVDFPNSGVSYDFGKTLGWQFVQGRDFSREFATDSAAFIINESAAKYIGFKNPVGEIIKWDGQPMKVIGVIKDVVVESPYAPVRPSLYYMDKSASNFAVMKIRPNLSARDALAKIEAVFKKFSPLQPFNYTFTNEEYASKFDNEERIGKLASSFAVLAIFISCLGLFGMATFMAEQRIKEIGVRKVLGASVLNLWGLLSKDFVALVAISLLIAIPVAYYGMYNWLMGYEYRSCMPWWIFAGAGVGALVVTLVTVSYQSIKAAMMNPVKSLKTE
jgi:ABC-type antimicrobial peptide transport system permease subunit